MRGRRKFLRSAFRANRVSAGVHMVGLHADAMGTAAASGLSGAPFLPATRAREAVIQAHAAIGFGLDYAEQADVRRRVAGKLCVASEAAIVRFPHSSTMRYVIYSTLSIKLPMGPTALAAQASIVGFAGGDNSTGGISGYRRGVDAKGVGG